MIVVNFKTYKEATGYKAIELCRICKKVSDETGVRIVAVPQLVDLGYCEETGVECWSQHVDGVGEGKYTGWVSVESVMEIGARGTLLNHSEHKMPLEQLKETMTKIGDMAFEVCLCADTSEEAKTMAELGPDYVAYEPPELIGSTDKSVATEKPDVVEQVVKAMNVPLLIGAGVKNAEDVRVGVKLGAKGVLLASGVVLAANPEEELRKLADGFSSTK